MGYFKINIDLRSNYKLYINFKRETRKHSKFYAPFIYLYTLQTILYIVQTNTTYCILCIYNINIKYIVYTIHIFTFCVLYIVYRYNFTILYTVYRFNDSIK